MSTANVGPATASKKKTGSKGTSYNFKVKKLMLLK
jgi:hypothetical protein